MYAVNASISLDRHTAKNTCACTFTCLRKTVKSQRVQLAFLIDKHFDHSQQIKTRAPTNGRVALAEFTFLAIKIYIHLFAEAASWYHR